MKSWRFHDRPLKHHSQSSDRRHACYCYRSLSNWKQRKEMNVNLNEKDCDSLLKRSFRKLGFKIIYSNIGPSVNGVDLWVTGKNTRPLSVEVKKVRRLQNGCYQVDPVSKPRQMDDLIAIVINKNYLIIEEMNHHIRSCGPRGVRTFTTLCKGL